MGKFVSVIVPTYNDAHYLDGLFQDIVAQTYKNVEYIIVNDCSTDNTEDVVLKFIESCADKEFKITYAKTPHNSRTGGAINVGIKIATGDILTWWSSDDRKFPNFIEKMSSVFDADEEVDYVIGGFVDRGVRKRPYHCRNGVFSLNQNWGTDCPDTDEFFITSEKMEFMLAHRNACLNGISFMFSKHVLSLFGEFLTKPEEDYHMSVKMIALARKIGFLNMTVAEYCLRPDSLTTVGYAENCRIETQEEFNKFFSSGEKQ